MKASKFRDIVATVAPGLATALGGPLAGVATKAIADKLLGKPSAAAKDVEAAILGASPADLVKLKELELEFQSQMQEAGIELEKVAAGDRASARDRQVKLKDRLPGILAGAIVIGYFGTLAYILKFGLPEHGREVLLVMLGSLQIMVAAVSQYYFGSSAGSKAKDVSIDNAMSKIGEVRRG